MLKHSVNTILLLLLTVSLSANTWLVSTTELVRGDTVFQTFYTYNGALQPVLISTKISVNNSLFSDYTYTEQQFEASNKTASSTFLRENSTWKKLTRTEWTYENGLLKNRKELIGISDNWANKEQVNYSYNLSNKVIREITQTYATNWKDKLKTEYNYDTDTTRITFSAINETIWKPYGRLSIANNTENSVIYEEFDSIWHIRTRTVYHQKPSGEVVDETQQIFKANMWKNQAKRTFTFDTNSDINGEILSSWKTEFWDNKQRVKTEIQNSETVTTSYTALYDEWLPAYQTTKSFNEENLPNNITTNYLFWGGDVTSMRNDFLPVGVETSSNFAYGHQISINYEDYNNTSTDIPSHEKAFTVYPNPSPNGIFYVDGNYNVISQFWVYNLQGLLIKQGANENNKTIDISELNKGIYLSKIITNSNLTFTTKLIKSN